MTEERATLRRRPGRLFAQVPEALIFHPDVSARGVRLWAMLDRRCAGSATTMPSRRMIAEALDCSVASVDRAIGELCDAGFLHKERADRGDVNAYEVLEGPDGVTTVHPFLTREDRGGVVTSEDTPRHPRRHPSSPMTTPLVTGDAQVREEREESREETPTGSLARTTGPAVAAAFDAWWAAYPRKIGKDGARRAYARVARKTDPAVLLDAARRYADDPTRDEAFTCHPMTWLNQGRWQDEGPCRPVEQSRSERRMAGHVALVQSLAAQEPDGGQLAIGSGWL